jgi:hypothetical protein
LAIGSDVRTYLLTQATVTAVVGTRIYPLKIPQSISTYPSITYQMISQVPAHTLTGGAGYAESRIQYDIYAETKPAADSLDEILRNVLQGFPPAGNAGTMGSSTVSSVKADLLRELWEPSQDNSDKGWFRLSRDYWIRHSQSVPTFA